MLADFRNSKLGRKCEAILSDGIAIDIYKAQQAIDLYKLIGTNVDALATAGFDNLMGVIQQQCISDLVLSTTKIFEPINRRYEVRSLHNLLNVVRQNAKEIAASQGRDPSEIIDKVRQWRNGLRPAKHGPMKKALKKLRSVRNKLVAHHELVDRSEVPGPTWNESEKILALAKRLTIDLGDYLLGDAFGSVDGSDFYSDVDAAKAAADLKRLLIKAEVIAKETTL